MDWRMAVTIAVGICGARLIEAFALFAFSALSRAH